VNPRLQSTAHEVGEAKAGYAMRRVILASAVLLAVMAPGVVVTTAVGVDAAAAAGSSAKAAFCGANDSLDRASAKVTSNAGFLAVLKTHTHDITILKKDAPSGSLGQTVQQTIAAAEAAITSNNPNDLNSVPSGGGIDTYCDVDGNGNPLPSYFGKGASTTFCTTFLPVYGAVGNAEPNQSAVLSALTADQVAITKLSSELSSLPKSIKAKATAAVDKAQTAITTKNPSAVGGGGGTGPAGYVALYCGQNQ
jgi:hypothetical protein